MIRWGKAPDWWDKHFFLFCRPLQMGRERDGKHLDRISFTVPTNIHTDALECGRLKCAEAVRENQWETGRFKAHWLIPPLGRLDCFSDWPLCKPWIINIYDYNINM